MIVAWAVKLRKTLNDSKDLTKGSPLTVSTCQSMDETVSCKSQCSPSGSVYGYETPTMNKGVQPLSPPEHEDSVTSQQALAQEYVNLTQVKEEMHKKLQVIESKGSAASTNDETTEFDSWCGEPHSLSL